MLTFTIPAHRRGDTWGGINSIVISTDGTPVNLSGSSIKMQFREDIDAPVILEFSTENSIISLIENLEGALCINPTIIDIPYGVYRYDLQVTYPNGTVKTYINGTWEIVPDITE